MQFENRQLQDTTDNLKNQLEISESRLMESAGRVQEAVELNAALQSEITRLKQQLTESETAIETLQSAARRAAKAQSENQELGLENRRLQSASVRPVINRSGSQGFETGHPGHLRRRTNNFEAPGAAIVNAIDAIVVTVVQN